MTKTTKAYTAPVTSRSIKGEQTMTPEIQAFDDWLRKQVSNAGAEVRSWGDTHNPNYWHDKGRLEAFMEMRVHIRTEHDAKWQRDDK